MKLSPSKCLGLLGFTSQKNVRLRAVTWLSHDTFLQIQVKQHQLIGSSVQVVVANPDSEGRESFRIILLSICPHLSVQPAAISLSAIIHALYEMEMAGIARYVFRNNANPRLCALVPYIKPNCEVLLCHLQQKECHILDTGSVHLATSIYGRYTAIYVWFSVRKFQTSTVW